MTGVCIYQQREKLSDGIIFVQQGMPEPGLGCKDASKILTKSKVTEFENKVRGEVTEEVWEKYVVEQLGFEHSNLKISVHTPKRFVYVAL